MISHVNELESKQNQTTIREVETTIQQPLNWSIRFGHHTHSKRSLFVSMYLLPHSDNNLNTLLSDLRSFLYMGVVEEPNHPDNFCTIKHLILTHVTRHLKRLQWEPRIIPEAPQTPPMPDISQQIPKRNVQWNSHRNPHRNSNRHEQTSQRQSNRTSHNISHKKFWK